MRFVETPIFTGEVGALLTDDEYRELQTMLVLRPGAGAVIPGSGGIRKLRWGRQGQGKRGGVRVIYYWFVEDEVLFMLMIYSKAHRESLTPQQVRTLRRLVEENL